MNENQIIHPVHPSGTAANPALSETDQAHEVGQSTGENISDTISESMGQSMANMRSATDQMGTRARHTMDRAEASMRKNPLPVILGTVALGIVIGWAAGRRPEPTTRERYIEEPAIRARDALFGILSPLARRLRDQYGRVRVGVDDTLSPMTEMDAGARMRPFLRRTGRFFQSLRFW